MAFRPRRRRWRAHCAAAAAARGRQPLRVAAAAAATGRNPSCSFWRRWQRRERRAATAADGGRMLGEAAVAPLHAFPERWAANAAHATSSRLHPPSTRAENLRQ